MIKYAVFFQRLNKAEIIQKIGTSQATAGLLSFTILLIRIGTFTIKKRKTLRELLHNCIFIIQKFLLVTSYLDCAGF